MNGQVHFAGNDTKLAEIACLQAKKEGEWTRETSEFSRQVNTGGLLAWTR